MPSEIDGVLMPNLILLYTDYVKRSSSDAFVHPNVFNPVVELYCHMNAYQVIRETRNRVTKLRGIALVSEANQLVSVLSNGVPGSPAFEKSTKDLYKKIMEAARKQQSANT